MANPTLEPTIPEELYRYLFEHCMDGVLLTNPEGQIFAANPAACQLFRRTQEEICKLGRPGLADPSDPRLDSFLVQRTQRGWAQGELTLIRADGTRFTGEFSTATFKDKEGNAKSIWVVRDISVAKNLEAEAERLTNINAAMRRIGAELIALTNERELYQFICDTVLGLQGIEAVWIALKKPHFAIEPVAAAGFFEIAELNNLNFRWDEAQARDRPVSRTIRNGSIEYVPDTGADVGMFPWRDTLRSKGVLSVVAVPIRIADENIGALVVWSKKPNAFNDDTIELIKEFADDIAIGVHSLRLSTKLTATLESLQQTLRITVEAIAKLIETRDPYTAGHERRVALIAREIGKELGLPEKQLEGLWIVGCIHDLGKIGVPAEILSKPTKLSDAEFTLIKSHSQFGHDVLKNLDFPWPVAQTVLQHHERIDGSGYPQGLKGDAILLAARIIGVADVVETMSSHRPYRPGLGIEAALSEIERGRGSAYDPQVVDACLRLFREKGYQLPA